MTTTSLFLQSSSTAGTGARSFSFLLFGSEIMQLVVDAKWFVAFLLALIVADFRFGWAESHMRLREPSGQVTKKAWQHSGGTHREP